jgi:hypothetical protein
MGALFDKLALVRRLEGPDCFSRPQAEALCEARTEAMQESVATKADLADLRHETTQLGVELRHEMAELRAELRHEMTLLRSEMKIWTGSLAGILLAGLGGLMAVFRFLVH